jgi:hypothetical protein
MSLNRGFVSEIKRKNKKNWTRFKKHWTFGVPITVSWDSGISG